MSENKKNDNHPLLENNNLPRTNSLETLFNKEEDCLMNTTKEEKSSEVIIPFLSRY